VKEFFVDCSFLLFEDIFFKFTRNVLCHFSTLNFLPQISTKFFQNLKPFQSFPKFSKNQKNSNKKPTFSDHFVRSHPKPKNTHKKRPSNKNGYNKKPLGQQRPNKRDPLGQTNPIKQQPLGQPSPTNGKYIEDDNCLGTAKACCILKVILRIREVVTIMFGQIGNDVICNLHAVAQLNKENNMIFNVCHDLWLTFTVVIGAASKIMFLTYKYLQITSPGSEKINLIVKT
jgi:hypothetical protein